MFIPDYFPFYFKVFLIFANILFASGSLPAGCFMLSGNFGIPLYLPSSG